MKGQKRKDYEIKLHKELGTTATPEQVTRIRIGASDLVAGASWEETLAWVKGEFLRGDQTMNTFQDLDKLSNFNLIKYTGHYALTIDRGMGPPIIIQGDSLEEVLSQLKSYKEAFRG